MAGENELARAGGRKDSPFEPLHVLGRDAEILGRLVDLAQRFGHQRLALVEREDAAELLAPALDRLRDRVQPSRALETFERSHRLFGAVRGFDRLARVGARALPHLRDHLAGRGTRGVEMLAALGSDPVAVDAHLLDRAGDVHRHFLSPVMRAARLLPRSNARAYIRRYAAPSTSRGLPIHCGSAAAFSPRIRPSPI